MIDEDEYPDPEVNLLLHRRADRDQVRGAEGVYRSAQSVASRPSPARRMLALAGAVAAGLLIVAGIVFAFPGGGDDESELVVAGGAPFAVCDLGAVPVGALADDPDAMLCDLAPGDAPQLNGFAGPFVVGEVAAVFVPGERPGTWLAEMAPRPELVGPVPDPPDGASGGAMLRSQQPVRFDGGVLAIETGLVIGHDDFRAEDQGAWYEVVVTTAGAPTSARTDGRFAKDQFAGHFTLGCRLEMSGNTICSLMDDSTKGETDGGRLWQTSFVDDAGEEPSIGGFERPEEGLAFTDCGPTDSVAACLDALTIEFTDTSVTIRLGESVYFEQRGLRQLPAEVVASDLHVYAAVMTSRSPATLLRFHGTELTG